MRVFTALAVLLFAMQAVNAQSDRDLSGIWVLKPAQSDLRDTAIAPARVLNVGQTAAALSWSASAQPGAASTSVTVPLDGKSQKNPVGDSTWNVVAKWEGTALLLNIIVSGPANYSVMERWVRSRDSSRLVITRNVIRPQGETESVLVYENPNVAQTPENAPAVARQLSPVQPVPPVIRPAPQTPEPVAEYVVQGGTRILMRLTNAVNTKRTMTGDSVYLQTAVPVFVKGRLIIPVGSYVTGTVTESQRAGRVKGKSALNVRFESVTLPNGVTRDFRGRAGSVDAQGTLDRTEGKMTGEGKGGSGARTVAQTTAAGTGIGSIAGAAAGHVGAGLGIGAAAGAVAGLAGVLGSRGADVVVPQGTTIELVLDRDLVFTAEDLRGRIQ